MPLIDQRTELITLLNTVTNLPNSEIELVIDELIEEVEVREDVYYESLLDRIKDILKRDIPALVKVNTISFALQESIN